MRPVGSSRIQLDLAPKAAFVDRNAAANRNQGECNNHPGAERRSISEDEAIHDKS